MSGPSLGRDPAARGGRRIALLTCSTAPRGSVVHTLALAEALVRCGADVTVWSLGDDDGFFRPLDPAVRVRLAS